MGDQIPIWQCIGELPYGDYADGLSHHIMLFEQIIVAFHCYTGEVWCMDTETLPDNKWFKTNHIMPIGETTAHDVWCFQDDAVNVHLIQMNEEMSMHVQAPLRDLISKGLRCERKRRHLPL